jgi:hypothetical protein
MTDVEGYDEHDTVITAECDHNNSELFGATAFYGQVEAVEWVRSRSEVVTSWTCPICEVLHEDERDPAEDGL